MTAVRKITAAVCCIAAPALFAQTTGSSRRPAPTVVTATPTAEANTTTTAPATPPVTADTDRDANDARALKLSLETAIKTAMERNVGIRISRYDLRASGEALRSQYGLYDWLGTGTLTRQIAKQPVVNAAQSPSSRTASFNVGVGQTIPTGGNYSVGFDTGKEISPGGFSNFSPS